MLLDVSPSLAAPNTADALGADTSDCSEFGQSEITGANQTNIIVGDLGVRMALARSVSISFDHLSVVVGHGAEVKATRVNANGPVAVMQDAQPIWNFSVVDAVRTWDTNTFLELNLMIPYPSELVALVQSQHPSAGGSPGMNQ